MYSKQQTYYTLYKFLGEQIRVWEKEYGVSLDFDKAPAIEAITKMVTMQLEYDPTLPFPKEENKLDEETVREFFKSRKMDIWGKDWEKHRLGGK